MNYQFKIHFINTSTGGAATAYITKGSHRFIEIYAIDGEETARQRAEYIVNHLNTINPLEFQLTETEEYVLGLK